METDSLEVTNIWATRHDSRSVAAPILLEIEELATSFNSFVICHIVRSANGPAHICAKHACTINMTESWIDSTPSLLINSLLANCSASAFIQ
uniref:RNase H type-1 domain-containing protein n=1 Tax=Hordeum vulgare subsp. vulgare TaxID=112509 RepID=A0A8I6Y823_HORVV